MMVRTNLTRILSNSFFLANLTNQLLRENDLVKEALREDKGKDVELLSWEINPFTNKGDNYSSIVACISVKYKNNETILEDSYVAKLNPLRPQTSFSETMEELYGRETVVLSSVIGGMNSHLAKLGLPYIRTPKLYAQALEKGREAFVTQNLRKLGFKMHDRKIGLDLNHANLVMKELGRFHASSLLFEETLAPKTIPESFDYFEGIVA
ncbi:hypothetical protein Anas_04955 [Armadillidium nasatum]|uniref:Uncharacterized protein n=1 Tax=Armadillidium nasatum TaxID=96803 RepID=A0A5N5SYK8_9CRUS|nr:hypothetical protein Anas_04955 [Armadillidium nasatum]